MVVCECVWVYICVVKLMYKLQLFSVSVYMHRVIVYSAYMDDEKKQVLQLFGQRSADITRCQNSVLCDLPNDLENPALLVTGWLLNFTI